MTVFVGDDWAEAHHDVHLMNDSGEQLARKRLPRRARWHLRVPCHGR